MYWNFTKNRKTTYLKTENRKWIFEWNRKTTEKKRKLKNGHFKTEKPNLGPRVPAYRVIQNSALPLQEIMATLRENLMIAP